MNLGLGYSEIALILIAALIVIGPRRLPQLLRDFGRIMGQLRRTSDELRRELLFSDEFREIDSAVRSIVDPIPAAVPPRLKVKPTTSAEKTLPLSPGEHEEAASSSAPEKKDSPALSSAE